MKKTTLALALLLLIAQITEAQYCSPTFANGCFNWRNQNITLGSINWSIGTTACTTSDYTNLSTTVNAGQTLPMSVTNGSWCGTGVWVDFNSDFTFDDSENLYHSYQAASVMTYNFNITIPANVPSGSYRMRVIAGWGSDTFTSTGTNGYGACGNYQYGSFQDFTLQVVSTNLCNANGNVIIYTNYDGGAITINVDQDIPNLHIGICTYEDCAITIAGAYAANVAEVMYVGYQGNNDNCNTGVTSTSISAPVNIPTSILTAPPSVLADPNGNGNMICAYSCGGGNQGGCNTAEQVVAYFLSQFGGSLYAYYTQYNCWAGVTLSVSAGGNCCPVVQLPSPVAAITLSDAQICAGNCINVSDNSAGNPSQWTWTLTGGNPAMSALQNPGEVCFDQPGIYTLSLSAANAFGTSDASATIEVTACTIPGCMYPNATNYNPAATVDNLSCQFPCDATDCPADLDSNGIVGVSDLLIFIGYYGTTCPN